MRYLRLLLVYLRVGVLNELQYRVNFFVQVFQSVLALATTLGGLFIVFSHTDNLGGWRPDELVALVGVYTLVGGAIRFIIEPSMQRLMEDVRQGTLDFTLVKPADAQALVSMRQIQMWKALDIALGLAVLGVALRRLGQAVGAGQALAFGTALLAGGAIIYSFWLVLSTVSFWFIRVDNILVIFGSMYEAGRWPATSALSRCWARPARLPSRSLSRAGSGVAAWPTIPGRRRRRQAGADTGADTQVYPLPQISASGRTPLSARGRVKASQGRQGRLPLRCRPLVHPGVRQE